MTTPCPSCGANASGKFCAECGAPLQGAACSVCRAPLTPGAKFCHRCGTPAGVARGPVPAGAAGEKPGGVGNALPWAVAAIALLALIALAAGQRFARPPQAGASLTTPMGAPIGAPQQPRAPDISSLTPAERAERLYDRIMGAAERGRADTVQFFMPMALQAYSALSPLNIDQRYDLGRLAEVAGDARLATAQADTILQAQPRHLLGLVLASRAARLRNDTPAAERYLGQLARFESAERQKQLPEYLLHQNDIETALAEWRRRGTR
jgi:hypothetical protein